MTTDRMLQFVTTEKAMPEKRQVTERKSDFDEIYTAFAADKATEQASRCSQCGVPFCQTNCPLHNNIPDWLMLTAEGRMEEAWEVSSATNTFPEICGRICPRIAFVRATASLKKVLRASPLVLLKNTLPKQLSKTDGSSRRCRVKNGRNPSVSSVPGLPVLLRLICCAAAAIRLKSMTAMTGSAAC